MDPVEGPWLHGFGLSGFRNLREDAPAKVGPLAKVNFLVGRNNHGKSSLLRAAARWGSDKAPSNSAVKLHALVRVPAPPLRKVLQGMSLAPKLEETIAAGKACWLDDGHVGVWVNGLGRPGGGLESSVVNGLQETFWPGRRLQLGIALSGKAIPPPNGVILIPAFRELRRVPEAADSSKPAAVQQMLARGIGLVEELGRWYGPTDPGSQQYVQAGERWDRLRDFMREVLEDPEADLEVASNQRDLHVRLSQAGQMLHIDALGDGIKQVLMIAAASILFDDHLVLLEEPEIHLHAGLQRKLIRFLAERTENQYVIATHSAHILDLPGAQIFHVTHDGTGTRVAPAVRASEVQRVCQDLGYMASDLLQANYTIWVEGPSDRIYWRRWLGLVDPDLVEGVHYTVMAYGGYLIDGAHLRDEPDAATEELIHLLKLGRQCTVIADSDKKKADDPLRPTLDRLAEEAGQSGSGDLLVCDWVSTVENLIPRQLFRDTVISLHRQAGPRLKTPENHDPFENPFFGMKAYSKVEVARAVVERLAVEDMDPKLIRAATELAGRIRTANGLPHDSDDE